MFRHKSSRKTKDRPTASARARRVGSSTVGPRPPVATTRSARARASRAAARISGISSGTTVIRCTGSPTSRSALARNTALVLRVSPRTSSVPMFRTSVRYIRTPPLPVDKRGLAVHQHPDGQCGGLHRQLHLVGHHLLGTGLVLGRRLDVEQQLHRARRRVGLHPGP